MRTARAWTYKEHLREILERKQINVVRAMLLHWCTCVMRSKVEPTIQLVREGKPFYSALEESEIFTDMAIDMVKVGEATGSLDDMLGSVSDFLDEQVETRMQRLLSLVEPMMLVFMGAIIAMSGSISRMAIRTEGTTDVDSPAVRRTPVFGSITSFSASMRRTGSSPPRGGSKCRA